METKKRKKYSEKSVRPIFSRWNVLKRINRTHSELSKSISVYTGKTDKKRSTRSEEYYIIFNEIKFENKKTAAAIIFIWHCCFVAFLLQFPFSASIRAAMRTVCVLCVWERNSTKSQLKPCMYIMHNIGKKHVFRQAKTKWEYNTQPWNGFVCMCSSAQCDTHLPRLCKIRCHSVIQARTHIDTMIISTFGVKQMRKRITKLYKWYDIWRCCASVVV